jgi:geranylgeranyl diphosphate synthase type II
MSNTPDRRDRIERGLGKALARATRTAPAQLGRALRYAVMPGGARIRPRLCLAVAAVSGKAPPQLIEAAACAIELLHCASLVHDDLPCFDDASLRRGKPALHKVYGEPLAVLTGDALIVLAFECVALAAPSAPLQAAQLLCLLTRASGSPHGLAAGQAMELDPSGVSAIELARYHRAKTGALFVAATSAGAVAAGRDPTPWVRLGETIGEAYQIADDLCDALASSEEAGKSTRRDAALGRPNAVESFGITGAVARLRALGVQACAELAANASGPACDELQKLLLTTMERMLPRQLQQSAA